MISTTQYQDLLDQYRIGCVFCEPADVLVIDETEHFRVLADAAPLRPGHIILHSKTHYSCAGDVPEHLVSELVAYKALVEDRMTTEFGSVVGYEHGRAGHCLTDGVEHRLCHHFHLHLLPGTTNVAEVLADRFERVTMDSYSAVTQTYADYGDYLFVEAHDQMDFFPVDGPIERHLLRTLVATEDGRAELADWKSFGDPDLLNEGLARLTSAFSSPIEVRVLR